MQVVVPADVIVNVLLLSVTGIVVLANLVVTELLPDVGALDYLK